MRSNYFKNFDCCDISLFPRNGGTTGIAANLACRGGGSENASTSAQTTTNQNVTVGNAAENSQQVAVGSNSNAAYAENGGVVAGTGSTVNIQNLDSQLVGQIGADLSATANNSIIGQNNALEIAADSINKTVANAADTANNSINAALGFGQEALASNQNVIAQTNQSYSDLLGKALGFGQEAIQNAQAQATDLSQKLAEITAATAPQTAASQAEQSAASGAGILPQSDFGKLAVIVGVLAAAVALFKPARKALA
jgi:hypothetical protein